eukprot:6776387-Lingulodinium_polyedra.AAC.1
MPRAAPMHTPIAISIPMRVGIPTDANTDASGNPETDRMRRVVGRPVGDADRMRVKHVVQAE